MKHNIMMKQFIIKYLYKQKSIDISNFIDYIIIKYFNHVKNKFYYFNKIYRILLEYHLEFIILLYKQINLKDIFTMWKNYMRFKIDENDSTYITIYLSINKRIHITIELSRYFIDHRLYTNECNIGRYSNADLFHENCMIKLSDVNYIINCIKLDLYDFSF